MELNSNITGKFYYLAVFTALLINIPILVYTFEKTYDANVHLFFASEYASDWFAYWSNKWYTGFTLTSYPPLVHQVIALMSKVVGLKLAYLLWSTFILAMFVRGIYHYSRIWVPQEGALVAAFIAGLLPSFVESMHVFGQLPSLTGATFLLNACPEIYVWMRNKKKQHLIMGVLFLMVTTVAHHVSTIFGIVFFLVPTMLTAIIDNYFKAVPIDADRTVRGFMAQFFRDTPRSIALGIGLLMLIVFLVFPYWYWSIMDPIKQVSIPHGSRDSFIENSSSGLVFFLFLWGYALLFFPFILRSSFYLRNFFIGASILLSFILGTGGTTPIPKMLLGETAFNILTLDRFTIWATFNATPFMGLFIYQLFGGSLATFLKEKIGGWSQKVLSTTVVLSIVFCSIAILNIHTYKNLQPSKIEMWPLLNFLSNDQHDQWRFLTLGFGDQMAWLSANTNAQSVDGNYHSARRLPELTSRAIERLENAKYLGFPGLGALQQFLTVPEKYHLKYIFSNDPFYDPLLYFSGWHNLIRLENGIEVWEKDDIVPLPVHQYQKAIPKYQSYMWAFLPMTSLILCLLFFFFIRNKDKNHYGPMEIPQLFEGNIKSWYPYIIWFVGFMLLFVIFSFRTLIKPAYQDSPEHVITSYFDFIDTKKFDEAYKLLDLQTRPTWDQFILNNSYQDGIVNSFAKLNNLYIDTRPISDDEIGAVVKKEWVTAVQKYKSTVHLLLRKKNKKWSIVYDADVPFTPSVAFVEQETVHYKNLGRRVAKVGETRNEDILDRPTVYVAEASLVRKDNQYVVVGELINLDNVPAYVTVEAILYDAEGVEITRYNCKDALIHNLAPRQQSAFRVDFEGIAKDLGVSDSKTFDPDQQTPWIFDREACSFNIFLRSLISDHPAYNNIEITGISPSKDCAQQVLELTNVGAKQVRIPLLITSYYDDLGALLWVDKKYLDEGIMPYRKLEYTYKQADWNDAELILQGTDANIFINGLTRKSYEYSNTDWDAYLKSQQDAASSNCNQIFYLNSFTF